MQASREGPLQVCAKRSIVPKSVKAFSVLAAAGAFRAEAVKAPNSPQTPGCAAEISC